MKNEKKLVSLDKLLNNPQNARKISVYNYEKLKQDLIDYPQVMSIKPIVIDSYENPIILAGNQRFKALKELGYTEISMDWLIEAKHLSEKDKKAFIYLDNNSLGEYDYDMLKEMYDKEELKELEMFGLDMPIEYTNEDLEDFFSSNDEQKGKGKSEKESEKTKENNNKEYFQISFEFSEKDAIFIEKLLEKHNKDNNKSITLLKILKDYEHQNSSNSTD